MPTAFASDIMVLGLFTDMIIIKVDGKQYKLKAGESTVSGMRLISSDSEKAVLEIDGNKKTFTLGEHKKASVKKQSSRSGKNIEARIWPLDGLYSTAGSINGQPVYFLVDTGASFVSMSSRQARRLGIDYRYMGTKASASTAKGVIQIYRINLDRVKVDGVELLNVEGAVIEGDSPREVLLGMSFLNRTRIEYRNEMMLIKKKW